MNKLNYEKNFISKSYLTISVLGKNYKLNIKYSNLKIIKLIKNDVNFDLILPKQYKNIDNLDVINQTIQKLYSEIAPKELEYSLEFVRHIVNFAPEDYRIERLQNCYYKIVKKNFLIINPDIMQYGREIINSTLIQAFCKMKFKPNSKSYKENLSKFMNSYENYKNCKSLPMVV